MRIWLRFCFYLTLWVTFFFFLALLIFISARAQEHNGHPSQDQKIHEQFYSTWMMPDNRSISCCSDRDCAPAEAHEQNGEWFARKEGEKDWTPIPKRKEEHDRDSPDGRSHMCSRQGYNGGQTVYCFIAGSGT